MIRQKMIFRLLEKKIDISCNIGRYYSSFEGGVGLFWLKTRRQLGNLKLIKTVPEENKGTETDKKQNRYKFGETETDIKQNRYKNPKSSTSS